MRAMILAAALVVAAPAYAQVYPPSSKTPSYNPSYNPPPPSGQMPPSQTYPSGAVAPSQSYPQHPQGGAMAPTQSYQPDYTGPPTPHPTQSGTSLSGGSRTASSSENCGTPDEFKACPPLPRHPLPYYPENRHD